MSAVLSDPFFRQHFRSSPVDNFFQHAGDLCEVPARSVSLRALQEGLPTIALQMANGLVLTMDGVGRSEPEHTRGAELTARGLWGWGRRVWGGPGARWQRA